MAIDLKSADIYRATRARPVHDGRLHSVQFSLLVPSGTLIDDNATLRLGRVDPSKCVFTRVLVDINGNLDGHATPASRTLVGTLGLIKSSDRSGNNLSFKISSTTTAADDDVDFFLQAAAAPIIDPGTVDEFGTAGDGAILSSGGFHIYNTYLASQDSRGYDANVMDVAISVTEPSSTATTADVIVTVTLEFMGVARSPSSQLPYLYKDRYGGDATGSL